MSKSGCYIWVDKMHGLIQACMNMTYGWSDINGQDALTHTSMHEHDIWVVRY